MLSAPFVPSAEFFYRVLLLLRGDDLASAARGGGAGCRHRAMDRPDEAA
jgi:hypothetical protein